jgi:hypothetical protein
MSRPQPHAGDGEMVTPTPPQPEPELPHVRAEAQRWVRRLRVLYAILGIYAVLSLMWFAIGGNLLNLHQDTPAATGA